jgi:hypothetical protein
VETAKAEFDERKLDHDNGEKNLALGEKIHPCNETGGLEMIENGG